MEPVTMLLLDFENGGVVMFREVLVHVLTAATLLIAKYWKDQRKVTITDRTAKIKCMCLMNKLATISRIGMGNANAF